EINPAAREIARKNGIDVYSELSQVEEESVDIVISNHAIEHVERPLDAIREMYRILKPGGRMIIVAPIDAATVPYRQNDKDFHLYSWSAGNLGNLASAAGFEVEKAERILHSWPPSWALIQRTFGWKLFHLFSRLWAIIDWRRRQVRVVARKSQ
ncbi:MAG: methyltransferase domain-containing protein, partial [Coleofasciculus sp. C2-GNP5-27]